MDETPTEVSEDNVYLLNQEDDDPTIDEELEADSHVEPGEVEGMEGYIE